jgi:hypothetical protein
MQLSDGTGQLRTEVDDSGAGAIGIGVILAAALGLLAALAGLILLNRRRA